MENLHTSKGNYFKRKQKKVSKAKRLPNKPVKRKKDEC